MNIPPYPAYKPSGIEWLGEIPESWELMSLRRLLRVSSGDMTSASSFVDAGYPVFGGNGFRGYIDRYNTEANTIIIGRYGALCGNVRITDERIWATEHAFRVIPLANFNPAFIGHLIEVLDLNRLSARTAQPGLNSEMVRDHVVALPPVEQQHAIAAYLDHETTRIDALIEKKQRQIELLREKRTTLISRAVTKGLDPNAKMKDSGIEWLGEIPEQWRVKRLRYLGYCQNGINIGAEYFGMGYPFVSYGDVYNNRKLPDSVDGLVRSSASDRERYSVRAGDVFFTRTSETIEDIGVSSVCLNSIHDAVFAGFLIRFRPRGRDLDTIFSKFYFQNIFLRAFFVKEMNLVTRASLSQDLLKLMPVLIPPLEEQAQIALFLNRETTRIDTLIEKVEKSIALLREYRTSLISAAVTGKIDVRKEAS